MSRRTFSGMAALAGLGAAAATGAPAFTASAKEADKASSAQADAIASGDGEQVIWTHCAVNCGSTCALQCHVRDGEIVYVESDNTGDDSFDSPQLRACPRGRSIRRWIQSPQRLN